MQIKSITVIEGIGADDVLLETDIPEATYPYKENLVLKFKAAAGTGYNFARDYFAEPDTNFKFVKRFVT